VYNETIIKSIIKSQHCQRNWDLSKTIPEDDLKVLETAVTSCPSKQNTVFYTPYFITNRTVIEQIYESSNGFTVSYDPPVHEKNSQVLANLLVVFVKNNKFMNEHPRNETIKSKNVDQIERDLHVNLGVASGYLNLTASMLGYSTGCCQCFDRDLLKEILKTDDEPMLLMGVGYKDLDRNRREHHINNFVFPTFSKKMSVIKID
jgi:nitroreductase